MTRCPVCGGERDEEDRCDDCRGWACVVCETPIYRDESFACTGRGRRHVRCGLRAELRPSHMKPRIYSVGRRAQ